MLAQIESGYLILDGLQENRRGYRELFLTAPDIGSHLSGCILYKETIYQSTADGRPFVEVLNEAGILVGIKVDEVCFMLVRAVSRALRSSEASSARCDFQAGTGGAREL